MPSLKSFRAYLALAACLMATGLMPVVAIAADHNDPNAANSILSDVPVSAADLYDRSVANSQVVGIRLCRKMIFNSVGREFEYRTDSGAKDDTAPAQNGWGDFGDWREQARAKQRMYGERAAL